MIKPFTPKRWINEEDVCESQKLNYHFNGKFELHFAYYLLASPALASIIFI
jgi:hypothetical protein